MKLHHLHIKNNFDSLRRICLKLLFATSLCCISLNAFAVDYTTFTDWGSQAPIYGAAWDAANHRINFSVMIQDTWGGGKNTMIGSAELYINGEYVAWFLVRPGNFNDNKVVLSLYKFNTTSGGLYVYAEANAKTNLSSTSYPSYSEFTPSSDPNYQNFYLFNKDHAMSGKPHRFLAEFGWVPNMVLTSDKSIKIELKKIVLTPEGSNDTYPIRDASTTVTIPMPPTPTGQSMTGGSIQQGGGALSFTAKTDGAYLLTLLKNGNVVSGTTTGWVSNATFTGKYITTETEFLNGANFSFKMQQASSWYNNYLGFEWTSTQTVQSQRTGVFTGNLSVTPLSCGKVRLQWQMKNPSSTAGMYKGNFNLEMRKEGETVWTSIRDVPYDGTTVNYSFDYDLPSAYMNQKSINLEFHIKRDFVGWDNADFGNIASNQNLFQRNFKWNNQKTAYKELTGITIASGASGYPIIKWSFGDGLECFDNASLKLQIDGTREINISDVKNTRAYQTTAADGVVSCVKQSYKLLLQYGSSPVIPYTVSNDYVYEDKGMRAFDNIVVSKGYYPDRINIKWYIDKDSAQFESFRLMRKLLTEPDDAYASIYQIQNNGILQYSYDDMSVNSGIYYVYRVDGLYSCAGSGTSGYVSTPVSVGFSQPYGSVSGRITYAGSSAVAGVSVNLATNDALRANRELEFSGDRTSSYVQIPANANLLSREGFTYQTWIKPLYMPSVDRFMLVNKGWFFSIDYTPTGVIRAFFGENAGIFLDFFVSTPANIVNLDSYQHITCTVARDSDDYKTSDNYKIYNVAIYINGDSIISKKITLPLPQVTDALPIDLGTGSSLMYNGLMDDIRLWNRPLTANEIKSNYNIILSGKETGLMAYYRCDETDEISNALFDCSAVGTVFNGNHALKGSGVDRSDVPLSDNHLSLKGVTDKDGIYSITNSIPFTSQGTTYTISPMFGIHGFDPTQRPLFFSPDSKVFNNVDFTDVSSFHVNGKVTYANSNYPVDSVMVSIDGTAASKDGKMVMTDAQGRFTVDVPIGDHFITVSKQGHVFADGGRFPANPLLKYNFQDSLNLDQPGFIDQTTVRLMGRVAGGQPETDKPLGFGLSKANIGQATITLNTVNSTYSLNNSGKDSTTTATIGGKPSVTNFKYSVAGSTIEIQTNPETGEFVAVLPPVPYNLVGVKTKDFEDTNGNVDKFSYSQMSFNMNPNVSQTVKYTDPKTGVVQSFNYNDSVKVTRYNDPNITISDKNAAPGAFGDSIYVYTDKATGKTTNIPLYSTDGNGNVSYALGVPVLTQKKMQYQWAVKAFEEYVNHDGADTVTDVVPLAGSTIDINNALASMRVDIDTTTTALAATLSQETQTQMTLDSLGGNTYTFLVGLPNINGNNQLACDFTLYENGKAYTWKKNAILFGQLPSDGSNFVTMGPDHVDIVLHDPPGSNSYAYIAKGSSYTTTSTNSWATTVTETEDGTISFGPKIETGLGFGALVITNTETKAEIDMHNQQEEVITRDNAKQLTTTFTEQISTSGDPLYVGPMADVYIGNSTNITFGKMRQLALYPAVDDASGSGVAVGDFHLFTKEILTADQKFGTSFLYTQQYLLDNQIPNMKALRNQLITTITNLADTLNLVFGKDAAGKEEKVKYLSLLPRTAANFGEPNTYYVFYSPKASAEEKVDQVQSYNTWILNWQKRIEDNEKAMITMYDQRSDYSGKNDPKVFENISYDAGVSLEKSLMVSYNNVVTNSKGVNAEGSLGGKTGFTFNKVGFILSAVVGARNEQSKGTTTDTGNSMTFGYVLSDGGDSYRNALSIDVYGPSSDLMQSITQGKDTLYNLSGYTFQRRAGQTSCPYEPADSTLFYRKNGALQLLNYGTFKIENADIYIDSKKASTAENISAGREASFNLQLQNNSETNQDATYQLWINPASNPKGLILSLDGEPLISPRPIFVKYGQELAKVLKVKQSSLDVLNYDSVEVRFGSICDYLNYTSAYISVHFTPASSPVTLATNNTLANRAALDKSGKIVFTISDYDRTFKNFGVIRLQYRKSTDQTWNTVKEYVNDVNLYPLTGDRELINSYTINYDFTYDEITPSDGDYVFRALAVSKIGADEIYTSSNEINVTKDVRAPQALGNPSPVSGILNIGDEVSITFNEDIQAGTITDDKFSIKGILNAGIRTEPTSGLFFDGNTGVAYTELPIFAGNSFSIESWIQLQQYKAGTLFAYGEGSDSFSLGFDASGHAVVKIGSETHTSTGTVATSEVWKYIGVSYDSETKSVSVYALEGTNNLNLMQSQVFTQIPPSQGRFFVGNNPAGNNGFKGAAGVLNFYDASRTISDASVSKYENKSGNEPNLIGLWELNEGAGAVAKDKARSRNLVLNTSWYVYPAGRSLAFNGSSNYAAISSSAFPFRSFDDFTYEFWFKGGNQNAATLLSVGTSAYIGFNASHNLILTVGSATQVLSTDTLLNDQWHHFALSVKRTGNTNAIIDGKVEASFNSSIFSGSVGGGYYYLAAKMTQSGTPLTNNFSEYFKGNIDEVRVWNSALSADAVLLEKNNKLRGTEAGLLAYYPFESYSKHDQIIQVYESLNDMVSGAAIGNMTATSDIAAPMQDARPVNDVSFTVTPSNRKIVLNITDAPYRLEGVTLTITAKDILDMHNNPSSAYTWIAYVNQSALKWETDGINMLMQQGATQSFKATIANRSGINTAYYIEAIPDWLTLNVPQGNLSPLATKDLIFNISSGINIGSYEAAIVLRGDNNVREILPVQLRVTGQRPGWSVNPNDFESSMNITGQIKVAGTFQKDTEDLLAAFIGNLCVGVTSPTYLDKNNAYFTFSDVYGNKGNNNQSLTFKFWDASTGRIYSRMQPSVGDIRFTPSQVVGSITNPVIFNTLDSTEQIINLKNGWNWISTNLVNTDSPVLSQMKSSLANVGEIIKGRTAYVQQPNWSGSLTDISEKNMYSVKTNSDYSLELVGKSADPATTPITLNNGWNWIGYLPAVTLPVNNALAGVNAQVDDYIKGQTNYAVYSGANGWTGSLSYMEPGQGYMYKSGNNQTVTFNYPSVSSILRSSQAETGATTVTLHWQANYRNFANSMTVTASLFMNGIEVPNVSYEIGAFSGNVCRGSAMIEYAEGYAHPYMSFLMIFGDGNEPITFKVYDHTTGKEYDANEHFNFQTDAIYGTPDVTYPITVGHGTDIESVDKNGFILYPNPVKTLLHIIYHRESLDMLSVIDMSGKVILLKKDFTADAIDVSTLTAGVYTLRIMDKGQIFIYKFVKM